MLPPFAHSALTSQEFAFIMEGGNVVSLPDSSPKVTIPAGTFFIAVDIPGNDPGHATSQKAVSCCLV
jgi:hypothetical protein